MSVQIERLDYGWTFADSSLTPKNLFDECLRTLAIKRVGLGEVRDSAGERKVRDITARQAIMAKAKKDLAKGGIRIDRQIFLTSLKDLIDIYKRVLPPDEEVLRNSISLSFYYYVASENKRPTSLNAVQIRDIFSRCFSTWVSLRTIQGILAHNPPSGFSPDPGKNGRFSFEMKDIQFR